LKKYKVESFDEETNTWYFCKNIGSYIYYPSNFSFKDDDKTIEKDEKIYDLTEENYQILLDKIKEFKKEVENAICVREGFHKAFVDGCENYYKKIDKTKYQIIAKKENVKICCNFKGELKVYLSELLGRFKYLSENGKKEVSMEEFLKPLYDSFVEAKDKYAISLFKYLVGTATKKDVDFINEYENADYLFVDREVYGIEDITDIRNIVLNRRGSMFGCRIYYELECKIDGKYYKMKYFPSNVESALWANSPQGKIKISPKLLEKIKVLTGQTEENIKTLKLLQVNTFLYGDNDGISKRSIEQQNKVFNDLSKVSIEDIKALPKHWQAKLSTPLLYDWLKCAGYSGDRKANEFVENLLKKRKVGK
jgi:hypothetical protein